MSMDAECLRENHFAFEADDDTIFFFNGILYFLIEYFGHPKNEAINAINNYYKWQQEINDDYEWIEWLGHDYLFIASTRIEYHEFLSDVEEDYDKWFRKINKVKSAYDTFQSYKKIVGW